MKILIKKALAATAVLVLTGFLSGCGGTSAPAADAGLKLYDGGEFTVKIDPSWKIINKGDFYADVPQETVVAFTAPEETTGFFSNVNVVKEDLKDTVTSLDYARANINLSGQNLTDYQKVQEASLTVSGQPTTVHIFQARLSPTEKLLRFVQIYVTKGTNGYIVTGGMLPDTAQAMRDKIGAMVTSFSLK